MKPDPKPIEKNSHWQAPPSLWYQLTQQQREQIAVVMIRILRQWQQAQEKRDE